MHLHVVVAIEGFVADSAGELSRTDEDLSRRRNPVLPFKERIINIIRVNIS